MKKWNTSRWSSIAAILMAVIIGVSACQTPSTDTTRASTVITPSTTSIETSVKSNYLSAYALAQKVAEAINSPEQTTILYQSIPDRQRPEIMLDDFVQYISLLRRGTTGIITTLTRISQDEMSTLFSDLRFGQELRHIGFYFDYRPTGKQTETIAFFLQQTNDGMTYLDKAPIAKALAMQNFAALYFDAIDRFDREALAVLIRSRSVTREPRLRKADRILTFYRNEIVTASPSFHVDLLMPDRIVYSQQIYVDLNKTRIGTRTITVFADGTAGFSIDDPIPDQLDVTDLQVKYHDKEIFDLSKLLRENMPQITSSQVNPLLGQPTLHDDTTCTVIEGSTRAMTAYYDGLIIEGTGRCDQHKFWRVDLKSAALTSSQLSLGSGISVGDTLDSLLLKYPFLDDTNYEIERSVGSNRLVVKFGISNQTIGRITITVSGA